VEKRRTTIRMAYCRDCGCQLGERILVNLTVGKNWCGPCFADRAAMGGRSRTWMTVEELRDVVGAPVGDE
jgi:hypothetical protein